ncbi:unnamed protein product [Colias eurytheme]|nr:unnamed protein product [Colias eurytheme]
MRGAWVACWLLAALAAVEADMRHLAETSQWFDNYPSLSVTCGVREMGVTIPAGAVAELLQAFAMTCFYIINPKYEEQANLR